MMRIIIEDYGKGVINKQVIGRSISFAQANKKIVTVDPKEEHFQFYREATSITPNRKELENAIRNLRIKDMANKFKVHSDRLFTDKDIDSAAADHGLSGTGVDAGDIGRARDEAVEGKRRCIFRQWRRRYSMFRGQGIQ